MMVSAIITTHNRKKLLRRAIESVMNQTYKDLECIVVDDAGTDETEEYIKDFIESGRIKYIYIPKNESKGGNHARNIGIQSSNGEYLAFLDDDDEWMPEKTEKQVAVLEEDAAVGFVYCGIITEQNMDPSTRHYGPMDEEHLKDGELIKEVLIRIITTTTTIMIRKKIIDEVGLFDEDLRYWQEYEYSIRLLQVTKAKCIREPLILYRIIDGDKQRLSNKISGWEESVKYIENKHKILFDELSEDERALRDVYVCIDGFARGRAANSKRIMIKYAWRVLSNPRCRKIAIKKYRNRKNRLKICSKNFVLQL